MSISFLPQSCISVCQTSANGEPCITTLFKLTACMDAIADANNTLNMCLIYTIEPLAMPKY